MFGEHVMLTPLHHNFHKKNKIWELSIYLLFLGGSYMRKLICVSQLFTFNKTYFGSPGWCDVKARKPHETTTTYYIALWVSHILSITHRDLPHGNECLLLNGLYTQHRAWDKCYHELRLALTLGVRVKKKLPGQIFEHFRVANWPPKFDGILFSALGANTRP